VTVDTVTDDLVLTDPADVTRYEELWERLQAAAMPLADSLKLLVETAKTG
jgi:hypothetical protein